MAIHVVRGRSVRHHHTEQCGAVSLCTTESCELWWCRVVCLLQLQDIGCGDVAVVSS